MTTVKTAVRAEAGAKRCDGKRSLAPAVVALDVLQPTALLGQLEPLLVDLRLHALTLSDERRQVWARTDAPAGLRRAQVQVGIAIDTQDQCLPLRRQQHPLLLTHLHNLDEPAHQLHEANCESANGS